MATPHRDDAPCACSQIPEQACAQELFQLDPDLAVSSTQEIDAPVKQGRLKFPDVSAAPVYPVAPPFPELLQLRKDSFVCTPDKPSRVHGVVRVLTAAVLVVIVASIILSSL